MIFLTTTAIEIDEELLNRCLVLTVDEDREQTQAIHGCSASGRRSKGCWHGRSAKTILNVHRNAQRLLRPLVRRQPLRPRADLPRRPDAHAARPQEVPDAHPHDRAAAPVPAAGEDRAAPTARRSSTSR